MSLPPEAGEAYEPPAEGEKEPRGWKGWFWTWNNPTKTGPEMLETLRRTGALKVRFQLERCPTTGTPHHQGGAVWKSQVRGSRLIKLFPGIWLRRLGDASLVYGAKEDTRLDGPWSYGICTPDPLIGVLTYEQMYPWQKIAYDRFKVRCDENRLVWWFWEPVGCKGKSALALTLREHLGPGAVLKLGLRDVDNYHMIRQVVKPLKGEQQANVRVVIFDFERSEELLVPYDCLGAIKSEWVSSGKYDSSDVTFRSPHVVCFANFPPAEGRISADRWQIIEL